MKFAAAQIFTNEIKGKLLKFLEMRGECVCFLAYFLITIKCTPVIKCNKSFRINAIP